jgi:glycosyltransferase involved in cell wall biosynthesis
MLKQDIIILPSSAEGMPVSIIEAMKTGVVPIVNDISGGIQELVENNVTGFKINDNNPLIYANKIIELCNNPDELKRISNNCINRANVAFDPVINSLSFENLFKQAAKQNKTKIRIHIYGSRLDKIWIPNFIVKGIREILIRLIKYYRCFKEI